MQVVTNKHNSGKNSEGNGIDEIDYMMLFGIYPMLPPNEHLANRQDTNHHRMTGVLSTVKEVTNLSGLCE